MKKVVITSAANLAVGTLVPEEIRRVHAWFGNLANWDDDQFVREHSHALATVPGVFVLRTSTDIRVFFSIEDDTIKVLDVAKKKGIMTTAAPWGDR